MNQKLGRVWGSAASEILPSTKTAVCEQVKRTINYEENYPCVIWNYLRGINGSLRAFNNKYYHSCPDCDWMKASLAAGGKINQMNYQINVMTFQTISERGFDGLNNLKRLNLENNRLKTLERGLFVAIPALTHLNLMRNLLETVTLHTIQPLMNNLVNHTSSTLLIKGNFSS